ncbi:hypothetical protein BVRB_1g016600 [Beta vulgaris subsp. vulgaris]|nr:hypothetical protein BVRB_1g016600 [Beta vulgaris subsp. vulgaris]
MWTFVIHLMISVSPVLAGAALGSGSSLELQMYNGVHNDINEEHVMK